MKYKRKLMDFIAFSSNSSKHFCIHTLSTALVAKGSIV